MHARLFSLHVSTCVTLPAVSLYTLQGTDDWLKANVNATGFYRVGYSADLWRRIAAAAGDPAQQHLFSQVSCTPNAFSTCSSSLADSSLHAPLLRGHCMHALVMT